MADVALDTPTFVYGLAIVLLPPDSALSAYARLSPSSALPAGHVARWWAQHPVTVVPVHPRTDEARARPDGGRDVPSPLVHATAPSADAPPTLLSAQHAVNAAHVTGLLRHRQTTGAGTAPWPPVHLLRIGNHTWPMDGVHRICAALAAGCSLPARVADANDATGCPCGWTGAPGRLLTHRCR